MITVGRLPVVRDELRYYWQLALVGVLTRTDSTVWPPFVDGWPEPIPAYVRRLLGWLDTAELFYVSEEMTAVAVQAGASLPRYELRDVDLPAPVGLLVWARPTIELVGTRGGRVAVTAALWGPATVDAKGTPGVHVVTLADAHRFADTADMDETTRRVIRSSHLMYHDESPLPFTTADVAMRNEALRAMLATWLLCGQPIAVEHQLKADRAVRRGYLRAGRPEPVVRQVVLRRPARPGEDRGATSDGEDGTRWRHRWVVRGHWRQQWYPSEQRHKPLWIAEYVKGPEGAPLIGGERVNVLRR